jgi:hypothetical protein
MRVNANDHADIFFVHSTNGGTTWTTDPPVRVNTDTTTNGGASWSANAIRVNMDGTTNDQWTPTIAVRPDGNMLFVGWLDRRNDTNNSQIDAYGRWATIGTNGAVTFMTNDFRITTQSFPPAFSGSLVVNTNNGYYDPVWAPRGVNLRWWYAWYPKTNEWGEDVLTDATYAHEAGEHLGACADTSYAYFVWSDNRSTSQATQFPGRRQGDVRLARLPWPQP